MKYLRDLHHISIKSDQSYDLRNIGYCRLPSKTANKATLIGRSGPEFTARAKKPIYVPQWPGNMAKCSYYHGYKGY